MDDLSRIGRARLPIWVRIAVVAVPGVLATGSSLLAYRWYVRPVTLSIAVGSLDGDPPEDERIPAGTIV
jgi:hypothetical protein